MARTNESDPSDLGVTDPPINSPTPPSGGRQGVTDPPFQSPDPSAAPPNTGFTIPTNQDGTQIGAGIPWANQADSHPLYAPAGYHWDSKLASFQPGQDTARPTGGKLSDPGYAASFVSWAAQQPGANPSLKNDPNYWIGKITSGELGSDENYIIGKFMQPEGAPAGGPGGASGNGSFADPAYEALRQLAMARVASLGQPQSFPQLDALMKQLQDQQAVSKQRASDLAGQWQTRVGELQQPLLSQPQVVQQRAMAENNLLASRDAALANAKARQAARGFAPTSGLSADEARQINENASNQQGQIEAQLQQANIGTDESRRNEATQLQGLITQALNGGDTSALQMQAQVADLENQQYQTDQNRQTQQLAAAQIPVDLTNQGFTNARSSISDPGGAFGSLMPLIQASLTGQNNQFNQSNSQMTGLAQIIQTLIDRLPH